MGLMLWGTVAHAPQPSDIARWVFVPSPNYDARPLGTPITAVVVHATEIDTLQDTVGCFLSPVMKVSAHFVVDRDGFVVQMVPVGMRAWHAGRSALNGVPHVNDYSVGIELVNRADGKDPYPAAQLRAAADIVRLLRQIAEIPDHRIVRHLDVARPKGRKEDPPDFDLRAFRRLCRSAG